MNEIILVTFYILVVITNCQEFVSESCSESVDHVDVLPDADVIIGVILNVHHPGQGVYGCGQINPEGLAIFEAMKWSVSILNQNSGLVNGFQVYESFIPGIKIGLRVYDSCSHQDLAVQQLTSLFPILKSGPNSCSFVSNITIPILGVIDEANSLKRIELVESIQEYHLIHQPLQYSYLSADYLAQAMNEIILVTFYILVVITNCQEFVSESCSESVDHVDVLPDADVIIGVILNVHHPGQGVYGCGQINPEGLAIFEAMKWSVSILNQNSGLVNGFQVYESFIPGIKIGLRVYDSCSHQDLAVQQLTSLFPILKSGPNSCSFVSNITIPILGVIDEANSLKRIELVESIQEYHLIHQPLQYSYLSADYLAQVLARMAEFLQWERIAILYENNDYSVRIMRKLSNQMCVKSVTVLPEEVKLFKKILVYHASRMKAHTGIIVIAQGKALEFLLHTMTEMIDATSRMQWLFSSLPPINNLIKLAELMNNTRVYSVAPHPSEIKELEDYWSRLKDPAQEFNNRDDIWFQEYLMQRKGCRNCNNIAVHDTESEVLYRTSRVLSAINNIFSFAHGLRSVWIDKCNSTAGFCEMIHHTSREEFFSNYLNKLEFQHSVIDRSPSGLDGRKSGSIPFGKLENCKLSLNRYIVKNENKYEQVFYQKIALYQDDDVINYDTDFRTISSTCSKLGCGHCTRNRQSRIDESTDPEITNILTLGEAEDIFIAVLLPLHQPGSNALDCSTNIKPETVEELEAVLWSINLINSNITYLPGIDLGVVVIDTCSSPLRLTHQLVTYLSDKTDVNAKVKLESVIGVISIGETKELEAASMVLSSLNITSVTPDARGEKRDVYDLQVRFSHYTYYFQVERYKLMNRQSRIDESTDPEITNILTLGEAEDIFIAVLLPLHQPGSNALDCSTNIKPETVEELEAVLWSINLINSNITYLPGIDLGVVVIDTCSSPLRLTHQLVTYLSDKTDVNAKVKLESVIGVISIGETKELEAASMVLSSLNITSVTPDARGEKRDVYDLQITLDVTSMARAVAEVFHHLGWNYIIVIYDEEHSKSFIAFKDESNRNGICFALEYKVGDVDLQIKLQKAHLQGAQVVILWTSSSSAKIIFDLAENSTEFVWIGAGSWTEQSQNNMLVKYEKMLSDRSFIFRVKESNIEQFSSYFEHLTPENSKNPWLRDYWNLKNCSNFGCNKPKNTVVNVIRAISSLTSGLALLRSEACRTERGLCPTLLQHRQLRQLLNLYIRRQTTRIDDPHDVFGFKGDGSGDLPIEIYKIQRMKSNWPYFQKVGVYQNGLKSLAGMVIDQEKTVISECISQCSLCPGKRSDYVVTESNADVYIAASLTVHESSKNPLECGKLTNVQQVEAFLWALDQVNNNKELLSDIKLGSIIMDTCGSREKTSRDVANIFSQYPDRFNLPESNKVIGFVIGQSSNLIQPVTDVTMSLVIPTVAPNAISSTYEDPETYPYLIRTGVTNSILSRCLLEILNYFEWNYVSIVYSDDPWKEEDLYINFKEMAGKNNIKIATENKLHLSSTTTNVDNVIHRLVAKSRDGSRIVILILNEEHIDLMMKRADYWLQEEFYKKGDIIWLAINHVDILNKYAAADGALSVTWLPPLLEEFLKYFQNLDISNNSRNPWFREYWASMYNCRGAACYSGLKETSVKDTLYQDPLVPAIIQSVFIFARGLSALKKTICHGRPDKSCLNTIDANIRGILYTFCELEAVSKNTSVYKTQNIRIVHFQRYNGSTLSIVDVGVFKENGGLMMNKEKMYYGDRAIDFDAVSSVYANKLDSTISVKSKRQQFMETSSENSWIIQFLLPIHSPGPNLFSCGDINDWSYQIVIGMEHFLNEYNKDLESWQRIGSLVFDTCGRQQRAQEQVFNLYASENSVMSESVVAAITFEEELAKEVAIVLETMEIPQIVIPTSFITSFDAPHLTYRTLPDDHGHASVLSSLILNYGWEGIYVMYSASQKGRKLYSDFENLAGGKCIANSLILHPGNNGDDIASQMKSMLSDQNIKVVILMLDDIYLTRNVIWAARKINILRQMIWIETEGWADNQMIEELLPKNANFMTVRLENPQIPGFNKFLTTFSPSKKGSIPEDWFRDIWQSIFKCNLNSTGTTSKTYSKQCSGKEKIRDNIKQSKYIFQIYQSISVITRSLKRLFQNNCNQSQGIKQLNDCVIDARSKLARHIQKELETIINYDIMILKKVAGNGHYVYEKVGDWKNGNLTILSDLIQFRRCISNCSGCSLKKNGSSITSNSIIFLERQPLLTSIKTVPNIVFIALSSLGIVLVAICALYFLAAFPVAVGTTILGYTILVGLLLLYASNFVFIIEPLPVLCGLRRFVMGFSYSIIYAGMLVKVMNTWRMMGYHGNGMMEDNSRLPGSGGLLVIALGLVTIQVILMASWLVLMPPKITVFDGKWKCEPVMTFEYELLVSHTYVFLLLFVTIVFGFVTWRSTDNLGEARWILSACLVSGVIWIAWPITTLYFPIKYRDHIVVSANLLSASLIMICLYLRKVYIYGKLSRQARDQEIKARLHPNEQMKPTYGTSLSQRETVTRGIQVRRMDSGEDGIVQVQAADLYPLDMYDGSCHFLGRRSIQRRR
ncbi:uncharacterized protein LOC111613937 [Centruroides sculpturatus]|uniref:uncharacterized protein LOC111613937 n=1 Tax=Centruroides sculpturatus TaxID=218467 RepID=UPI000C6E4E3E|nr:uncharacterized protein LOC111613937 [Centruroides sculpturatus]